MSDFDLATLPDLLARLSVAAVIRVADDGSPIISRDEVWELCKECAAAIRALMAERDAAYVAGFNEAAKRAAAAAGRFVSDVLYCREARGAGHVGCSTPAAVLAEIKTMWLSREIPRTIDLVPHNEVERAVAAERARRGDQWG